MSILQPMLMSWYQFGEPTPDHNEACGQNATASSLVGGGILPPTAQAPLTVDAWMRAQRDANGDPRYPGLASGGTATSWLQDALEHFAGVRGQDHGNDFSAIAGVLNEGRYVIALVGSDHYGHPVPDRIAVTGHWVAVFGWDGSNYHVANSGSGTIELYAGDYFAQAYRRITLDTGIHPKGDHDMDPAKEESLDQAFAWETFESVLGRIADGPSFAWALGEARKSHSQLLWEIIQGEEYAGKPGQPGTGGLLGILARQQAQIDSLLSRLSGVEQQEAAEAADKAQADHLAAIAAAAKTVQTALTSPLPSTT